MVDHNISLHSKLLNSGNTYHRTLRQIDVAIYCDWDTRALNTNDRIKSIR